MSPRTRAIVALCAAMALATSACGGSGETKSTATTQADRDQAALLAARHALVRACEESGGPTYEVFSEHGAAVAKILYRRPDEQLPNGKTARQMASDIVAELDATEVCFTDVEALRLAWR